MKRKIKIENYLMRVDKFVYDYKFEDSIEKVIVALADDINLYSIYYIRANSIDLTFTNMSNNMICEYLDDLNRNLPLILKTGREG